MKCPLCKGEKISVFLKCREQYGGRETFGLFECGNCGFVFLHPPAKEPDKYYFENYYERPGLMTALLMSLRSRKFRKLRKGRLLDVGCGSGFFLQAMKRRGWDCQGIEVSSDSSKYLEKIEGVKTYSKPIEQVDFGGEKFDLITFWHVMEHVDDPNNTVKAARRLLNDDGMLFIAVPNIRSMQSMLGACKWFHLDLPRHRSHFSQESLNYLLTKNGFDVIKLNNFSLEYNPFGYMQTLYNLAGVDFNFLYKMTKSIKPKVPFKKHVYSIFMIVAAFPLLLSLSFALSAWEAAFASGGTMEIYARKSEIQA